MAYTTINKSKDYFNTLTYSGNGSARTVTGVGFQPDMFWIKNRSNAFSHLIGDIIRGGNYYLTPNSNTPQNNDIGTFASASDGYSLSNDTSFNQNNASLVGWNWKAGGASTTTPSGGTITTTVSANTTAGFSIFTYTGNGNAAHLAHGLGVAPSLVLIKCTSHSDNWFMKHPSLNANQYLYMNDEGSVNSGANVWSNTNPDATKIYVGTDGGVNGSGRTYVGYAFAEKTGYSKFGTYNSTGYSNGPFIYTGFRPDFFFVKNVTDTAEWEIYDSKRLGYNDKNYHLNSSDNTAEASLSGRLDFLSNGVKIKITNSGPVNSGTAGKKYIYMAFGQSLVGSNNVPNTAR